MPARKKSFFAQASVLKRFIAFIVDLIIINVIILFPFKGILESSIPTDSFSSAFEFLSAEQSAGITIIMLSVALVTILYFVLLERKIKQTVGKMLFGLYVVSLDKEAKTWQLFVRSLFLIPVFPFAILWIIDPIVMFFTKENQRLSEILSKTKTVEKYDLR